MVEKNKALIIKLIFLISVIALISAFFIEYILGHQPCNLCILERIPYILAIITILLHYKLSTKDCLGIILDLTLESVVADEDTLEAANGRGAIL